MPSINGEPQDNPDWNEEDGPIPVLFGPEPKYSFENFEARMYLIIKDLLQPWPEGHTKNAIEAEQAAVAILEEYELSLGPLPEWSYGHNVMRSLQQGAQLQTKDGRRIGNAWVTSGPIFGPSAEGEASPKYYDVFTDAGSKCTLSEKEIHEMFHIGPFFSEPDRVFRHFGRPD